MDKYILKPVIVDAAQWFPEVGNEIQDVYITDSGQAAVIYGPGGSMFSVESGDWCVRGPGPYISVYTPEEFHKLYEEVFPGYKGQA